jgi:surface protein
VIGEGMFAECYSLKSIDIPSSVTSIENSAFAICNHMTSVTIPSSVKVIGDYAFDSCYSLTSVTLSRSTGVGNRAFESEVQIHYRD